jgi:hypothetical protein
LPDGEKISLPTVMQVYSSHLMSVHTPTAIDSHLQDQASFWDVFMAKVWPLLTNLACHWFLVGVSHSYNISH